MRISSRGTVSMGLLGWLIVGPFILMAWLVITAVKVAVLLVAAIATSLAQAHRTQEVRRPGRPAVPPRWPNIPPSGR